MEAVTMFCEKHPKESTDCDIQANSKLLIKTICKLFLYDTAKNHFIIN